MIFWSNIGPALENDSNWIWENLLIHGPIRFLNLMTATTLLRYCVLGLQRQGIAYQLRAAVMYKYKQTSYDHSDDHKVKVIHLSFNEKPEYI